MVQQLELFSPSTTTSNWTQNTVLAVAFLSCLFVPLTRQTGPSGQTLSPMVQEASAYPALLDATNTNLSLSQKEVLLWHQRLLHALVQWIQSNGSKTMHPKEVYMTVRFFSARIPVHRVVASLPSSVLRVYAPKPLQDPQPTHPPNLHRKIMNFAMDSI